MVLTIMNRIRTGTILLVIKDWVQYGILGMHRIKIRIRHAAVYLYKGHFFMHILAIIKQGRLYEFNVQS
jgi:hypothetical protein